MFEFAAGTAFLGTIIIFVVFGYHKEGGGGAIAFIQTFGFLFVVYVVILAVFS